MKNGKIKAIIKMHVCVILCAGLGCGTALGLVALYKNSTKGTYADVVETGAEDFSFENTYKKPVSYPSDKTKGRYWRDGMIGGNGKLGFVTSGAPYEDTIMYQDVDYIMPSSRDRYLLPDLTGDLEKARQSIVDLDDSFEAAGCGDWNYGYAFHPGQVLRISQDKQIFFKNYARFTDYQTGEVGVTYTDKNGEWIRKTFTSRTDDVTVTVLTASSTGAKLNLVLSLDDPEGLYKFGSGDEVNMQYKKTVSDDGGLMTFVAHYPGYELASLKDGGYAGVTKVIVTGGTREKITEDKNSKTTAANVSEKEEEIKITDADTVILITKNDRTFEMGDIRDFAAADSYALTDELTADIEKVYEKYGAENFDYSAALAPSAKEHNELMNCSALSLNADEKDRQLSNTKLLSKQKTDKNITPALMERLYKQAEYSMVCSSGYSITRLSGMWTGEWMPGWRSEYTMDANVNLQTSGMNTTGIKEFGIGYIKFVLRQIEDWKTNAEKCYGMKDAIMAPVNADGDGALGAEYAHSYPFQYWNAGASWMIQPIFEFYQCFGDMKITVDNGEEKELLKDILLPLLTMQSNFWEQLVTPEYYTDADGNACYEAGKTELKENEKYLIIPSYSPENTTGGEKYNSTLGANAAIDIGAARSGLEMTVAVEKLTKTEGYKERAAHWKELISLLPDYLYNEDGSIKEWCANQFEDNNKHRHISHLYCAWPLFDTQNDETLAAGALKALDNRQKENSASHGFVHQALVNARLKQGEKVYSLIKDLVSSNICYDSLMTDHNTNRGSDTYCTDTELGMLGIINESLLYSDEGIVDVLPALSSEWTSGEIKGLRARTDADVSIKWDNGKAYISITSFEKQEIKVSCKGENVVTEQFGKGETKTFEFAY